MCKLRLNGNYFDNQFCVDPERSAKVTKNGLALLQITIMIRKSKQTSTILILKY